MESDSISRPSFGVSNTEYQRHKEGFDPDIFTPPILVEMTGILKLRFSKLKEIVANPRRVRLQLYF